jgi:hypothetical protein
VRTKDTNDHTNVSILRKYCAPNREFFTLHFSNNDLAIAVFQDVGILRSKVQNTRRRDMALCAYSTNEDGFRWRCQKKVLSYQAVILRKCGRVRTKDTNDHTNVSILRKYCAPNREFFTLPFSNNDLAIAVFQDVGILRSNVQNTCRRDMALCAYSVRAGLGGDVEGRWSQVQSVQVDRARLMVPRQ